MKFLNRTVSCVKIFGVLSLMTMSGCATTGEAISQVPLAQDSVSKAVVDYSKRGAFKVVVQYDSWPDVQRGRDIKVKIYEPKSVSNAPVVIFSHGLGGSVEAAPYLGEHLASWGILAIHVQHPGSDGEVWKGMKGQKAIVGKLRTVIKKPKTAINRYQDIPFIIDEIETRSAAGELPANPQRIALAGHSFGAHTVLALAGRNYKLAGRDYNFRDNRLVAGIALSPPSPGTRVKPADYKTVYGKIDMPLLHITGTKDGNPLNRSDAPKNREIPFSQIHGSPQYLVVFDGADHAVFGGIRERSPEWYPKTHMRVNEVATTFLASYLLQDAAALKYLDSDEFEEKFNEDAKFKKH